MNFLLRLGIGDAFGAAYEFTEETISSFPSFRGNPKYPVIGNGMYTDDTQMTIGVMKWLNEGVLTEENLNKHFWETYKHNPVPGYSKRIRSVIEQDFNSYITKMQRNSVGNGAAMRTIPIGVAAHFGKFKLSDIPEIARISAISTHTHPDAILGAQAVAIAAYCSFNKIDNVDDVISDYLRVIWRSTPMRVGSSAIEAAKCAIAISKDKGKTLSEILINSINLLGDTDTTAAIAMGLAENAVDDISLELKEKLIFTNELNVEYFNFEKHLK